MDLPVERAERLFPVTVDRHEFLPDTGGPGEHRGGLGMVRTMTFHGQTELGVETARTKEGTPGVVGGESGSLGRLFRNRGADDEEVIGGYDDDGEWHRCIRSNEAFEPGESFTMETQGGGGWGRPEERDPESVLADVRDGKVTEEHARAAYGVVVADGKVNEAATAELRSERREE
jgi:N-methylhydantoinase B/oxoprolinase/acetone carboxylase alpha subunit